MRIPLAAAGLMLALAGALPAAAQELSAKAGSPAPQFVPADFAPPARIEGPGFVLVPLGPALVKIDFDAYMSSIEHLQRTFTRSNDWPTAGISDADALKDMETEQARFSARTSFAYSVLTPDGKRERGCVYVYPSPVPGYDALVQLWVTKAEYDAGFDAKLQDWVSAWIAKDWPFRTVAYPGRAIPWATWDTLIASARKGAGS
ncbi:twin-arginine translocation pathway signal protein [Novosphingobium olei]|uniref:Twin-arginine translocation pathway signal protein n=1 Tax=Novosphingobium olei TaxID=2728851 RepID=A0A7Y0GAH0_9SPHN|nr:twin-arginine translocation pathway signal protein [Novosphingobium olei]NML94088.1 twin-arginine translocation pathway signal protein [Novosphingobium olei]